MALSLRSWVLLLAAIGVATVTVVLMASSGPVWPDLFASCGGDGIYGGGPERERAIADWHAWWLAVYVPGLAVSSALAVGWVWATGVRPSRTIVRWTAYVAVAVAALLIVKSDAADVVLVPTGLAWALALQFPDTTPLLAPAVYVGTVAFAGGAARRFERRGQAVVQIVLAGLLVSAWLGLACAATPSSSAFAC
jgi:hypothetical protein